MWRFFKKYFLLGLSHTYISTLLREVGLAVLALPLLAGTRTRAALGFQLATWLFTNSRYFTFTKFALFRYLASILTFCESVKAQTHEKQCKSPPLCNGQCVFWEYRIYKYILYIDALTHISKNLQFINRFLTDILLLSFINNYNVRKFN